MKQIIYRKNKMFMIDKEQLKAEARRDDIYNALYAAIYLEFQGASKNQNYSKLTNLERFNQVNTFAYNWLLTRGLI